MTRKYEPTDEQRATVRAMSAYGINRLEICAILGITKPTLHKHFRKEIDTALAEANAKVAQALFNMATKEKSVAAMCFWLKTRAKWRETDTLEESAGDLAPSRQPMPIIINHSTFDGFVFHAIECGTE